MNIFQKLKGEIPKTDTEEQKKMKREIVDIATSIGKKVLLHRPCLEQLDEYEKLQRAYYLKYPDIESENHFNIKIAKLRSVIDK